MIFKKYITNSSYKPTNITSAASPSVADFHQHGVPTRLAPCDWPPGRRRSSFWRRPRLRDLRSEHQGMVGRLGCTKTTEFPQRSVANQLLGSIDWIAEEKFKSTALHCSSRSIQNTSILEGKLPRASQFREPLNEWDILQSLVECQLCQLLPSYWHS